MVNNIVAIYVERAFIEIGCAQHTVAIKGDIVACFLVHNQLKRGVGVAVDKEVEPYVSRYVHLIIMFGVGRVGFLHIVVLPCNKVGRANRRLVCSIVYQYTVLFGHSINVDNNFTTLALYIAIASDICSTIECIVAKRMCVVGKKVLCLNLKRVRQIG